MRKQRVLREGSSLKVFKNLRLRGKPKIGFVQSPVSALRGMTIRHPKYVSVTGGGMEIAKVRVHTVPFRINKAGGIISQRTHPSVRDYPALVPEPYMTAAGTAANRHSIHGMHETDLSKFSVNLKIVEGRKFLDLNCPLVYWLMMWGADLSHLDITEYERRAIIDTQNAVRIRKTATIRYYAGAYSLDNPVGWELVTYTQWMPVNGSKGDVIHFYIAYPLFLSWTGTPPHFYTKKRLGVSRSPVVIGAGLRENSGELRFRLTNYVSVNHHGLSNSQSVVESYVRDTHHSSYHKVKKWVSESDNVFQAGNELSFLRAWMALNNMPLAG